MEWKYSPNSGPRATTNKPFPTLCSPKAAGSFSKVEYSDIQIAKFINADPLTNPAIASQVSIIGFSTCIAKTEKMKKSLDLINNLEKEQKELVLVFPKLCA